MFSCTFLRFQWFGTYFTHGQTCNVTRVQSATEWTASVHTLHMPKPNVTRVQSATEWTASVHSAHMSKPNVTHVQSAMCKARGIRNFHVKRNKFEFAKKLPDVKRPKRGVVAGTQCIDRMWASLDKFIPPELSNKSGKGGTVNEKIFTYLYAWVWRYHLPKNANFKVELAKIC